MIDKNSTCRDKMQYRKTGHYLSVEACREFDEGENLYDNLQNRILTNFESLMFDLNVFSLPMFLMQNNR